MCNAKRPWHRRYRADPGLWVAVWAGTGDATLVVTMKNISSMMTKKNLNTVLKGVIAAMPAIPYIMRPKKTPIAAYVVGGIGFAVAGGLAALFFFSPKTRVKALTAAKEGYGKVSETIGHLHPVSSLLGSVKSEDGQLANGFGGHSDYQPSPTGL